ncbi:MAG: hypothetical protein V7708_10870 [Oceanicoccus sp.]
MAKKEESEKPSATFNDWVGQWERAVDKFSNQLMGTSEFSQSMNLMQNMQLEYQRAFGEQMAKQLANFNMPSRDDILELSEVIRDMDRRMARVETSLNKLEKGQDGGAKKKSTSPPRTKRPPAKKA